jgi:nucleolin
MESKQDQPIAQPIPQPIPSETLKRQPEENAGGDATKKKKLESTDQPQEIKPIEVAQESINAPLPKHRNSSGSDFNLEEKNPKKQFNNDSDSDKKKAPSKGNTELYIANLKYSISTSDIKKRFEKYGDVENVKLLKDSEGRSRGIAFVKFNSIQNAEDALKEENGKEWETRPLKINFAGDKPKSSGASRPPERRSRDSKGNETVVFVGNISFDTDKKTLTEFFKECGEIRELRLAMRDDGKSKGFAHIEFASKDGMKSALKKNGSDLDGRKIRVDEVEGSVMTR